jgi:hypothetical protein
MCVLKMIHIEIILACAFDSNHTSYICTRKIEDGFVLSDRSGSIVRTKELVVAFGGFPCRTTCLFFLLCSIFFGAGVW